MENALQVQVHFESFHPSLIGVLPESNILIPVSVAPPELRELLASIFPSQNISFKDFDFSIDGQHLSGSLGSFLERNCWSHENLLTILIIARIQKPTNDIFSLKTDDWVSSIATFAVGSSSLMAFGDYSGRVHFIDSLKNATASTSLVVDKEMPVKSVLATPSSSYLVVSHGSFSSIISVKEERLIMGIVEGHSNTIEAATIVHESQNSIVFATGSFDKTIRISKFTLSSPNPNNVAKTVFEGHSSAITGLALADAGGGGSSSSLISASLDGSSRHWDLVKEEVISTTAHGVPLLGITICPLDSNLLAAPAADLTIRLWDVRQKNPSFKSLHGHKLLPTAVLFSKTSSSALYSVGQDGVIKTWDLRITGRKATSDASIGEMTMPTLTRLFSLTHVEEASISSALAVGGDQGLHLFHIE